MKSLIQCLGVVTAMTVIRPVVGHASIMPQDASKLTQKCQEFVKANNYDGLRGMGEKTDTLDWTRHIARPGDTNWKVYILKAPSGSGAEDLLVFSAYHTCQSIGDHVHRLSHSGGELKIGAELPEYDPLGIRIRDHAMTVNYDIPNSAAIITDDVKLERISDKISPVLIRLSANFKVDSITLAGKPLNASIVPGFIEFTPPSDKNFSLKVAYHGDYKEPGMDNYIKPTEAVMNSYWYPHVGRLPAKLGVTVKVPKGWTAVGQGSLVSKQEGPDGITFVYRNEIATSYFSLNSAPYFITSRNVNGRTISACQIREDKSGAESAINEFVASMSIFEKYYGPYPYTHYELVQTLGPFDSALEAYSFATFPGGYGAVTHELSHTWWGGIVPNPYTRSMWNEGFANYSDSFARRVKSGKVSPALRSQHAAPNYGRNMITGYGVSIVKAFDTESPIDNNVGYGKASLVLAMLEDIIGVEKMAASMKAYRDNHVSGEAGSWEEFERNVKTITGVDYRWFFEQWTERPGVPVLKLANVKKVAEGDHFIYSGQIVQEGKPYRLPLEVEIKQGDKVSSIKIMSEAEVTNFRIIDTMNSSAVRLDPGGKLLVAGAKMDAGQNPFLVEFK